MIEAIVTDDEVIVMHAGARPVKVTYRNGTLVPETIMYSDAEQARQHGEVCASKQREVGGK